MSSLNVVKNVLGLLPQEWQSEMKRVYYGRQIRRGTFHTAEPEYSLLDSMIKSGQWVLDIGANIGHYTRRFSELAGPGGRVLAFEPVPETFTLLAANLKRARCTNVTLINAAASDKAETVGFAIPSFKTGMKNYYEAHIASSADAGGLSVLTLSIDSLALPNRVAMVKIDAEGHEYPVLQGMLELLRRDHPLLIVETDSEQVVQLLSGLGYSHERLPGSPNLIFRFNGFDC
jgi:FkbM family methyltransferase